ncbi:MAG TPA: RDD family protein [Clostridium sp.]|uniref:RDD family protein n=1 Tax=Clostridium sp. TaxID=1506 RepID=UPI002F91D88B
MLEQNEVKKNEEIIEELNNTDNKSEAKNEGIIKADANKKGLTYENKTLKPNFLDTLKASLIDVIIIGVVSTIIVFVADALLKLTGYAITQKFQMSFIIFMVVMVLYMSIMESGKTSSTFGKKVAGLIIIKR